MRLLHWLTEAYGRPLAELSAHAVQPIRDGRVTCPQQGREVSEAECLTCPGYVRTHTFDAGDGWWRQTAVVCDPAAAKSDSGTTAS